MFFAEFDSWLRSLDGAPTLDGTIMPQLRSLVAHAMRAAAPALRRGKGARHTAFQLFGFDFMVDADLRAHLIEVNSSPAAASQLLPALTEDLIAAAIDPLFPPPTAADASGSATADRDERRGAAPTATPLSPAAVRCMRLAHRPPCSTLDPRAAQRIAKAVGSLLPSRRGSFSPQRAQAYAPTAASGAGADAGDGSDEQPGEQPGEPAEQAPSLPPPPPAFCAADDAADSTECPGSAADEALVQVEVDTPAPPASPPATREEEAEVDAEDSGAPDALLDALPAPRKGPSDAEAVAIEAVWFCGPEKDAIPPDWASRDWSWHIMARRGFEVVADLSDT